jgi:hypothetical protein
MRGVVDKLSVTCSGIRSDLSALLGCVFLGFARRSRRERAVISPARIDCLDPKESLASDPFAALWLFPSARQKFVQGRDNQLAFIVK